MTGDPVFLVVLGLQACIFARCCFLAREDDSDALDGLWKKFKDDVRRRAGRGDGPDWVRYMDESDRVHERRIDRLRVWATAALVLGIGGTMFALVVRLPSIDPQSSDAAATMMAAVGSALGASLTGVANNLLITLGLFHWSDGRFESSLNEFRNALEDYSDKHEPLEKFSNAVRDQLGQAFREAVKKFPDAFAQLDENVEALGEVIEAQSTAVLKAAVELKTSAEGLSGAASEIAPVAHLLGASIDRLRTLPDEMAQTVDKTYARWERELRRDQHSFIGGVKQVLEDQRILLENTRTAFVTWEQQRRADAGEQEAKWRAAIELLQESALSIVKTADGLPATFAREVGKTSDTMGKQFGLEAKQHVEDLTKAIRDGNSALGEQIAETTRELQNRFLNDTANVVSETVQQIYRETELTLLASLKEVGEGLREALETLPEHAGTFATSLTTADQKLQRSIDRLTESAAHLQQVAKLTEEFEAALTRALRDATTRSLAPLSSQMQDIVTELRRSAGIPQPSNGFIRRLFRRLTLRRKRTDIA